MKEELQNQIEITSDSILTESYNHQYITNDTKLILENQLIILKTLQKLLP